MEYDEWSFPPLGEAKALDIMSLREEISIAETHTSVLQDILDEKMEEIGKNKQ